MQTTWTKPQPLQGQAGWFLLWKSLCTPSALTSLNRGFGAHGNQDWSWLAFCFPRAAPGHWVANEVDVLFPSIFKHWKQQPNHCESTEIAI